MSVKGKQTYISLEDLIELQNLSVPMDYGKQLSIIKDASTNSYALQPTTGPQPEYNFVDFDDFSIGTQVSGLLVTGEGSWNVGIVSTSSIVPNINLATPRKYGIVRANITASSVTSLVVMGKQTSSPRAPGLYSGMSYLKFETLVNFNSIVNNGENYFEIGINQSLITTWNNAIGTTPVGGWTTTNPWTKLNAACYNGVNSTIHDNNSIMFCYDPTTLGTNLGVFSTHSPASWPSGTTKNIYVADTGINISAGGWYTLEFEWIQPTSEIKWYVNGMLVHTLSGTDFTNYSPHQTDGIFGPELKGRSRSSGTNFFIDIDYVKLVGNFDSTTRG